MKSPSAPGPGARAIRLARALSVLSLAGSIACSPAVKSGGAPNIVPGTLNPGADAAVPSCGDGRVDPGEQCDNGPDPSPYCAEGVASCKVCDSSCHYVDGLSAVAKRDCDPNATRTVTGGVPKCVCNANYLDTRGDGTKCVESIGGAMLLYNPGALPGEQLQRIIQDPNMRYILSQVPISPFGTTADWTGVRATLRALAAAGKKNVVDIFPNYAFWEAFGLGNIAQSEAIRNAFFDHVIGPFVDYVGKENIYAMHLYEENGAWWGSDAEINPTCGSVADFDYNSWFPCVSCKNAKPNQTCISACNHDATNARYILFPGQYDAYMPYPAHLTDYLACVSACTQASCSNVCPAPIDAWADGISPGRGQSYSPDKGPPRFLRLGGGPFPPRQDYTDMCNINRYEPDFIAFTTSSQIPGGCTFAEAHAGSPTGCFEGLIRHWIETRILSKADLEFARTLHQRYPTIKAFSFPDPVREDIGLMAQAVDGFIVDPYSYESAYRMGRQLRLLAPEKELIYLGGLGQARVPGGYDYAALDPYVYSTGERRSIAALGALMGANGVGVFEANPPSHATGGPAWTDYSQVNQTLARLPVQRPANRVLLIGEPLSGSSAADHNLSFFKTYDYLQTPPDLGIEVSRFDQVKANLGKYDMIIFYTEGYGREQAGAAPPATHAHGDRATWDCAYHKQMWPNTPCPFDQDAIDAYVQSGGIAVFIGGLPIFGVDYPSFSKDYLADMREYLFLSSDSPSEHRVTPTQWTIDTLGVAKQPFYLDLRYKGLELDLGRSSEVHVLSGPSVDGNGYGSGYYNPTWNYWETNGGIYYDRGQGGVAIFPMFLYGDDYCAGCANPTPYVTPAGYDYYGDHGGYRAAFHIYLREVLRGLARYKGKTQLLDAFVESSQRDIARHDGPIRLANGGVGRALSISYRELLPFPPALLGTTGTDLFTGRSNVGFDWPVGGLILGPP